MKTFFLLLLIQVIALTLEYEFRCPVAAEWRLRPRKLLCGATQYVCLLYLPDKTYHETCDGLDISNTGSKLVFQPNFNKARCNYNRYQPFTFSTDGSSACVYKKSFCNAEGQLPFNKGSFENDTRCGCNVSKGYTFVTKPRNKCYCIPLEEDCSCYKPTCNNKGNDCTSTETVIMNATCSMLPENNKSISSVDEKIHKRKQSLDYDGERRGRKYRLPCVYFTVAVLIVIILTGLYADQLTITVTTNAENIATDYGKSITLSCNVSVICTCFVKSIEWYKGKNKIKCCRDNTTKYESDRMHLELTIKDVDTNDLGDYTCVLNTIFSTYKSKDIEVVYALPKIVVTTQLIEIIQNGESIELPCNISSRYKTTSVNWFKGSDGIIENRKKYELKGNNQNILCIHDVNVTDSGTYKCSVENEKGRNESEGITVVYSLPVIAVENQLIEIPKNGQSIKLMCYISSRYKPTSIKWFKGSGEVSENRKKYESKGNNLNILTIHDVNCNDSGIYKCRVDNEKGHNESEEITVKYSLPEITVAKKRVEILKNGESIELSCNISSRYKPTSIKWFKGADELINNRMKYELPGNNSNILIIHDVKISDSGTYTCRVETGKGRNESEGITVIYSLPVINVKEKKIEILENRKSIQLSCEVCSEFELISIKWFKGFAEITGNNKNKQKYEMKGNTPNTLIIHDVRLDDTGTYKCRVKNIKGYSESEGIAVVYNVQSITNSEKNKYLEKINSGKEARQYVRIQVIGKEGVGKSSLVHRLLGKQIEGIKSTDGIEIFKSIQIRKDDGKWIVDEVETERQKRIRRIMKIADINEKPTEISSETQKTGIVSEPEPKKKEKIASKKRKIKTKTPSSNVVPNIHDDKKTTTDNLSTALNSGKLTLNMDKPLLVTIKPDKKKSDVHEHEKLTSLEITDEMTAKIFENMDEILLEVKKGKEELKSGRVVECGIWDFAGQKDYYVTHQTFLTSGAIYLLVANLKEDIKAIRYDENCDSIGEYIDFWFDSVHSFCKNPDARMLNPPVIMVCTHTDQCEKLDERISEYAKQFDCIIGQNTKANHKRNIHYISNTQDNGEIDELKRTISRIAEDMSYFQVELPTHWIQLENALDFLTSDLKTNILSWTNILELGNKMLIKGEGELLEFLNYQHKIGNIIFFNDIREYIILQPNWLVKCFRCLVCDDDPKKRNPKISSTEWKALTETGRLSETIIDDLFQNENVLEKEQKAYVLSVMEKFDIIVKPQCVGTEGDEKSKSYYIPCMIRNRSISVQELKKEFEVNKEGITISPWFILEFTFLPFAYFNHILVSYIKSYTVCGKEDEQKAIYEGKAVIFLDDRKSRKLIICYSKNAISLQVWKWDQVSDDLYKNVLEELYSKIKELENKLGPTSYTVAAKCDDGNYFKKENRIRFEERNKRYFENGTYYCEDHVNAKFHHIKDIENTWFRHVDTIFEIGEKKIQNHKANIPDYDRVPKHIRAHHEQEIREWEQDQTTFLETRATRHILESLSSHNCIVVTGSAGCGKSSNIHQAALHLRDSFGYDIIPVLTGPTDIMNYYNENKKQVFIVDDICGKETIDVQRLQTWREYSEKLEKIFKIAEKDVASKKDYTVLKLSSPKLLLSCKLHIYKESQFQLISLFTKKVFNLLSPELCLLEAERKHMLHKYLPDDIIDNIQQVTDNVDYFPLLCKLSKDKTSEEVKKLFTVPLISIKQNINNIIHENKEQFCVLVLCIVFNEGFDTDWLKLGSVSERKNMETDKLEYIVKEFDIDLSKQKHRNSLKAGFSTLNGTYLKLRGTEYRMIHDKIYKMAAVICGQHLTECFIKYAPAIFIRDNFIFESVTEVHEKDDLIVLLKDEEEDYFERLLCDLTKHVIISTFNNYQLIYQTFRDKLISFLKKKKDANTVLKKLETEGCKITKNKYLINPFETHYYTTPLIESTTTGYIDIVQFLIVNVKCNVNKTDSEDSSPLYRASERGHSAIAKLLLENNADVYQYNVHRESPLYAACKGGHKDIVELLLQNNADVNQCDTDGETPLYVACIGGHKDIVELLLQNNADVNQCDTDGETPLYVACEGGHTYIELLLQNNADVNQCNDNGESPLYVACEGGHTDLAVLLLRKSADVSQCNRAGESPLYVACKGGHSDIVELLLQNNADVSQYKQQDGQSPLHAACEIDPLKSYNKRYSHNIETVKLLLAWNADAKMCNKAGQTPVDIARKSQNIEIVNLLMDNIKSIRV